MRMTRMSLAMAMIIFRSFSACCSSTCFGKGVSPPRRPLLLWRMLRSLLHLFYLPLHCGVNPHTPPTLSPQRPTPPPREVVHEYPNPYDWPQYDPVSYTHLTLPRIERCRSRWSPYH